MHASFSKLLIREGVCSVFHEKHGIRRISPPRRGSFKTGYSAEYFLYQNTHYYKKQASIYVQYSGAYKNLIPLKDVIERNFPSLYG